MSRFVERVRGRLAPILLLAGSAAYLLLFVRHGWVPGDVGLLGQTAVRVLDGELPHREFIDMYTGGLAFLHAAVFRAFGVHSVGLRWLLFAATLAALPAFYLLARRAARPAVAAAATAIGVSWGVPLYFESMPSWYNLFLAGVGTELLLRYRDRGRRRDLVAAGACAGVSIVIKSAGLLFVAAAFLYFVLLEQDELREKLAAAGDRSPAGRGRRGSVLVAAGLALFALVVVRFIGQWWNVMNVLHFVVPGMALSGLLLWRETKLPPTSVGSRLVGLSNKALPFLGGLAVPIALFLLPYALAGAWTAIADPAILFPSERVERAYYSLPNVKTLICALPVVAVFLLPWLKLDVRRWDRRLAVPGLVAAGLAVSFGARREVYQLVWFAARPLVPLLAVCGAWTLARGRLPQTRAQDLFLVLAAVSLGSLVQFPLSMGIYFAYVAPLVALAYLHIAAGVPEHRVPWRLHGVVGLLFLAFGVIWNGINHPIKQGAAVSPRVGLVPLGLERAELDVSPFERDVYQTVVELVGQHSPPGSCILATPDAPEIYYLADRCNPTPTFTEIFDPDYGTTAAVERMGELIRQRRLPMAIVNRTPAFSTIPPELIPMLGSRFARRAEVGQFLVFWEPTEGTPASTPR